MFNDIKIAKYDKNGNITKYVKVPVKLAPKSKQWYWIEKTDSEGRRVRDKILPIISVQMVNVEYNSERKTSKHFQVEALRTLNQTFRYTNPEPFTYTFEVKIAAKYIIELTQILEQILPYFTPTNYVRITIPELNINTDSATQEQGAKTLELKTILESSSQETSVDIEEANYRALLWNLQFKVDGYLFTNTKLDSNVLTVVQKIYTSDEAWSHSTDTTTEQLSGIGHDSEEILTWATSAVKYDNDGNVLSDYEIFTEPEIIDYLLSMGVSGNEFTITWDDGTPIVYE
jgi:hypothetical protein